MMPFGEPSSQSNLANRYTQTTRVADSWLPSWVPNPTTWLNPFAPGRATSQKIDHTIDQTKQDAADTVKPFLWAGLAIIGLVGASYAYKNFKSGARANPRWRRRSR